MYGIKHREVAHPAVSSTHDYTSVYQCVHANIRYTRIFDNYLYTCTCDGKQILDKTFNNLHVYIGFHKSFTFFCLPSKFPGILLALPYHQGQVCGDVGGVLSTSSLYMNTRNM